MSWFEVNPNLCTRSGLCARVCPSGIIRPPEGEDGLPELIQGAQSLCIRCGHCVAACPEGALAVGGISAGRCTPVRPELRVSPEQAEQLLRSRRSIRSFQDRPVDKALIHQLIETARYAPSGHNSQPVEWLVIHDSLQVKALTGLVADWMRDLVKRDDPLARLWHADRILEVWESGRDRICRGAPHMVTAHGRTDLGTAPTACVIALAYLEIAAYAQGLGACWAGFFNLAALRWPPMAEALNLPPGHTAFGSMMLGYPDITYQRIPPRKEPPIVWR